VQLVELRQYYAEFQNAGVGVYAISVDPPEQNARLKARMGAGYEFLSDVRGELLDALDIRQAHRSPTGKDTAIVRWVYRAETWRIRPHPRLALEAIREMHSLGSTAIGPAAPLASSDRGRKPVAGSSY
jgi:peroxiredoxin